MSRLHEGDFPGIRTPIKVNLGVASTTSYSFEIFFIGKKPNEYNPGSILEIEYKFGSINYKELFMIGQNQLSKFIIRLSDGFIMPLESDKFGKDYSNITNIIVKKET